MDVKERILTIKLIEKIKKYPNYANSLNLDANINKTKEEEKIEYIRYSRP